MDLLTSQGLLTNATGPTGFSGYTAMLELFRHNWGTQIQTYGDSIEYHHHFMFIYHGTWQEFDEGPLAPYYPEYHMYALDQMIINNTFFPSAFRSGWSVSNIATSNWLEQWIPFDYTPLNTTGGWSPINEYNGMYHWKMQTPSYINNATIQQAFAQARDSGSSIYSFFMHADDNMRGSITDLQKALLDAQVLYPGVTFKYVTASQAMQLDLGYADVTAPTFTITRNSSIYIINSNEVLWNNNPYIAVLYNNGTYSHLPATPVATNTWTVNIPNSASIFKVGVAANDLYGNPGVSVFSPLAPSQGPIPSIPTPPATQPPEIQVSVHGITASNYLDSDHTPYNANNGIEETWDYWGTSSAKGLPQWLTLDLWSLVPVNQVITHFYDGRREIVYLPH